MNIRGYCDPRPSTSSNPCFLAAQRPTAHSQESFCDDSFLTIHPQETMQLSLDWCFQNKLTLLKLSSGALCYNNRNLTNIPYFLHFKKIHVLIFHIFWQVSQAGTEKMLEFLFFQSAWRCFWSHFIDLTIRTCSTTLTLCFSKVIFW